MKTFDIGLIQSLKLFEYFKNVASKLNTEERKFGRQG